jgi:hypothetical protein
MLVYIGRQPATMEKLHIDKIEWGVSTKRSRMCAYQVIKLTQGVTYFIIDYGIGLNLFGIVYDEYVYLLPIGHMY